MNPRGVAMAFAGLRLAALAAATGFAKGAVDPAKVAAVQSRQLHWSFGLHRQGQAPARGILGRYRGRYDGPSDERTARRHLVRALGRRQALKTIKADRRAHRVTLAGGPLR